MVQYTISKSALKKKNSFLIHSCGKNHFLKIFYILRDSDSKNNIDTFFSISECSFPAMGLHISLPESLKGRYMTIRGISTSYDHYSYESRTFDLPAGCEREDIGK